MTKCEAAKEIADKINAALKTNNVLLRVYNSSRLIKKGMYVVAKGDSIYINGRGGAFVVGSFDAHIA